MQKDVRTFDPTILIIVSRLAIISLSMQWEDQSIRGELRVSAESQYRMGFFFMVYKYPELTRADYFALPANGSLDTHDINVPFL